MIGKRRQMIVCGLAAALFLAGCSGGMKSESSNNTAPQMGESSAPMSNSNSMGVMEPAEAEYYDRYDGGNYDYDYAEDESATGGAVTADAKMTQLNPEKIIQTANINLQTERFDETVENLRNIATENGGYVESANLYSRYVNYQNRNLRSYDITLRVPTDQFEETRRYVESLGLVTGSNQSAEDVTATYYDLAGRLETKLIEEERVLDMISRAKKIEDLLALEERLGDIRTQIERYQSQMNSIDRLAAFSTIYVYVSEVTKEELIIVSDNLGGRIQKAFMTSVSRMVSFFQNVVIFLAGAAIPLVIIGLLTFIGIKAAKAANAKYVKKGR